MNWTHILAKIRRYRSATWRSYTPNELRLLDNLYAMASEMQQVNKINKYYTKG